MEPTSLADSITSMTNINCYEYSTGVLISPQPNQDGNKLQRKKILSFICSIYNNNQRNISTIYEYIQVSHELRSLLRESVPYVKIYRYNPEHLCPKLNCYGHNGNKKVWTSCISAYCTSSALSALTEQCSRHLCERTSSAQRDKIVLHYCQIFMRYVQCLVTLRTTMT